MASSYLQSSIDNIPWEHDRYELLTAFYNRNCQYLVDYKPMKNVDIIMELCSFKEYLEYQERLFLKQQDKRYVALLYNYQKYFISLILGSINAYGAKPSAYELKDVALRNFKENRKKANQLFADNKRDLGIRIATYFCCQNFLKEVIFPIYLGGIENG